MREGYDFGLHQAAQKTPLVSIVVPVFNEADAVAHFVRELDAAIAAAWSPTEPERPPLFEIVFVDDGSRDATSAVITEMCRTDRRIRLLRLSRNFGKEAALCAGLRAARGDAVVPMDVDLQDPPALLRPMIDCWRKGVQVVNARRVDRSEDSFFKRSSARAFYRVINWLADQPIAPDVGDFRLLDRRAVDAVNQLEEHHCFNKGLFSWVGFRTEVIEYARPRREVGQSKWRLSRLLGLAIDGIVSSTTLPLRIWTMIGALIACGAFGYALFLIVRTLLWGIDTPGYASLMVAILFLNGLILFTLGILGEYVGRIAMQVRGRPLYIIAETIGFDDEA
jgi:glycosyltransferase involved in cell wall biosynthesis